MIKRLTSEANVPGVHLCTLNLEKSVQRVLEGLGWGGSTIKITNKLIAVSHDRGLDVLQPLFAHAENRISLALRRRRAVRIGSSSSRHIVLRIPRWTSWLRESRSQDQGRTQRLGRAS